jgi:uncharacterized protein (DUF983 family)
MGTVNSASKALVRRIWNRGAMDSEKRDIWVSKKRGFRGRCLRCGEGRLFRAFLKVDEVCPACGLDLTPQLADDLPAYLVIVIVGHVAVYLPSTSIASLILLQPVKGAVVGMQWALRMHGFSENAGSASSD